MGVSSAKRDYYEVLNVARDATPEQVKKALVTSNKRLIKAFAGVLQEGF